MNRMTGMTLALLLATTTGAVRGDDEPQAEASAETATVSFLNDVAPILVGRCVGCHNAEKAESDYNMATFAALTKGGMVGEGFTVVPGEPGESYFVELLHPEADPRMPYKEDEPLPAEQITLIERWITEGATYDGEDPAADWVSLVNRRGAVAAPESYPVAVPITALAFSPDGTTVAASGYHELTFWNVADGSLKSRLAGLPERTYDIAYSADGAWLATASGDPGQYGAAKLWKANPDGSAEFVRDLVESNDATFAVAFSPDNSLVAAAGADRAIRLFQVESGEAVATIEDHADWIFDLAFSPDGKRLASASRDKTAKVFDVAEAEALVTFPGHAETVYAVSFSTDGTLIASGGADKQIRVFNPDEDAKQVRAIGGFGGDVFRVQYHPNGEALIACGSDRNVRVFNPADGAAKQTFEGHADWVYTFAISPDGATLASGSWDGEVRLWNLAEGAPTATILAAPGLTRETAVAGAGD